MEGNALPEPRYCQVCMEVQARPGVTGLLKRSFSRDRGGAVASVSWPTPCGDPEARWKVNLSVGPTHTLGPTPGAFGRRWGAPPSKFRR